VLHLRFLAVQKIRLRFTMVKILRFPFLNTFSAGPFPLILSLAVLISSGYCDEKPAAESTPAAETDDTPDEALPGLRQPGEDTTFELRDESKKISPEHTDALAHYMAGLMAQRRGELPAAEAAFSKAVESAPGSAPPLKALAMVQFRMGHIEEGLKTAVKAIDLDADDYETRFELAQLLAGSGRETAGEDATRLIEAALRSKTLDHKTRIFAGMHQFRARLMLAQSKIAAAAESYEVILQALERPEDFGLNLREHQLLQKDRSTGYLTTGRVLLEAGRTDEAIRAFQALDRLENSRPGEHHLLLARAFFMRDKLPECETNLETYFRSGQRDNSSLILLKDLLEAQGRSDSLNERLEQLSVDASDATSVKMFQAQTLLDKGDATGAADIYQKLLDERGEADAYLGLMRVEIVRKNPKALIVTMNRAVRARIQLVEFLPMTSQVVADEAFAKALTETCEQVRKDRPEDMSPAVTCFCATVAGELEQWETEGRLLQATLELNPERKLAVSVLTQYGVNLIRQQKYQEASQTLRQLISLPAAKDEERLFGLYLLSEAEKLSGNSAAALAAIKEALRISPGAPRLHFQHGSILAEAAQYEAAEEVLRRIPIEFPDDAEHVLSSELQLAEIFSRQGRWADTITQCRKIMAAENVSPKTLRVCRTWLSNAYVQSGDIASGEKVLEEVYEQDPADPGINNDLGYLYADQGKNLEKAESMIRIAVASQPENPAYLDSLGWVLYRLGRHDEALVELTKATADPEFRDSTILEHLGDVYDALKKPEMAKQHWTEALKIEQESERSNSASVTRLVEKLKEKTSDSPKSTP
jgi:tetratricopeptide (TPR) repeat protein